MKKKLLWILLVAMACVLLSGCKAERETLRAQKDAIVAALNEEDYDAFLALAHPSWSEAEVHARYDALREIWVETDADTARMNSININASGGTTSMEGTYRFPEEQGIRELRISYVENPQGKGVTGADASVRATGEQALSFDAAGVFNIAWRAACLIFELITILDIVRKRPQKYGWYIVLALVPFTFFEAGAVQLAIPAGSIVWWCIRRSVLKKQTAPEALPAEYPPVESGSHIDYDKDPWEWDEK